MTNALKLILLWLTAAFSIVGFVAGFNIFIDPFGYFGTNTLGYYFSSERQFKFGILKAYDYNAIVLGDSRIAFTDPSYINRPEYSFVNGGMAGASLAELVALLSASRLGRLKLAVFGLIFNDLERCSDDQAPENTATQKEYGSWDALRFAASWAQLNYAVKAVKGRAQDLTPKYHADGTRSVLSKTLEESVLDGKTQLYWSKIRSKKSKDWPPKFEFGAKCRELLAEAQELADRHDFALVIVFLPRNSDLSEYRNWDPPQVREQIAQFLAQVEAVVPHVVDLSNSSFSDSRNFWLNDPTHFRPEVGAQVIQEAIRRSLGTQASK
jgi:hypothetical protein